MSPRERMTDFRVLIDVSNILLKNNMLLVYIVHIIVPIREVPTCKYICILHKLCIRAVYA